MITFPFSLQAGHLLLFYMPTSNFHDPFFLLLVKKKSQVIIIPSYMCVIDNLVLLQLSWRTLQVFHYMLWQSVQNREKTMISKAPSGFLLNSSGIYYSLITRYCSWSQYYLYNNQKYTVFANEYFCIIVSAQHC